MSGLQIFNAHPALYWGDRSDRDQPLLSIRPMKTESGEMRGITTILGYKFDTTGDRKSTRLNSSHGYISYAVFCLKKKKKQQQIAHRSKDRRPTTHQPQSHVRRPAPPQEDHTSTHAHQQLQRRVQKVHAAAVALAQ